MKTKTEEITIICAWCNTHMGTKEGILSKEFKGKPTHSICKKCTTLFFEPETKQQKTIKVLFQ